MKNKVGTRARRSDSVLSNGKASAKLEIELDREIDGRWIAGISQLPGVMVYGRTRAEAIDLVKVLALRVIADRLEHNEEVPDLPGLFAVLA